MKKTFIKCAHSKIVKLSDLKPNPRNPNKHDSRQIELLAKIIDHTGQRHPIIVSNLSGLICAGHGRLMALEKLGWTECAVDYQDFKSEKEEFEFLIADNKIAELAEHDELKMIEGIKELDIDDFELLGLDDFELPGLEEPGGTRDSGEPQTMREQFLTPPFSVLNAREGDWQNRKRHWLSLGILSELGRGENPKSAPGGGKDAVR